MMTDIEIAQSVKPRHILEIAKEAGIEECEAYFAMSDDFSVEVLEGQISQIKAEGEARKAEREAVKAEKKAAEKVAEAEKAAEKAGIELDPVCSGCGAALAEGVKFCGECGKPVE